MDPSTWGLGASPSHQYIVQVGTTRQLLLQRMGPKGDSNLPGALVPPRRALLPDRWRWRAAVPLERCRAGAAASMTTQPVSTLSTSHTGHPCLTRGGQLPALWENSCIRPRKESFVCATRAPHPV